MANTITRLTNAGNLLVDGQFDEVVGVPVVDASLQLWVDANQTASYPGSGTTWFDLSGNRNHLQFYGTQTYTTNVSGTAAIYINGADGSPASQGTDGSTMIRTLTGTYSSNTGSGFTISVWSYMAVRNGTGQGLLFSFQNADFYAPGFQFQYRWTDPPFGGTVPGGYLGSNVVEEDYLSQWRNTTAVISSGQISIYRDGVFQASTSSGLASVTSPVIRIGSNFAGRDLNGYYSNVLIYNRPLSPAEVARNYNALAPRHSKPIILEPSLVVDSSLKLWLDASDRAGYASTSTIWIDLSGNNRGTIVGSPAYSGVDFVLTGTQYVNITSSVGGAMTGVTTGSDTFTVSGWVKSNSTATYSAWFTKQSSYDSAPGTPRLDLGILQNNSFYFSTYNATSGVIDAGFFPYTLTQNTWYYLVMICAANFKRVYVNGVQQNFTVGSSTFTSSWPDDSQPAIVGGDRRFVGSIAQVQIYNRALTADEVVANYNALAPRYAVPLISTANNSSRVTVTSSTVYAGQLDEVTVLGPVVDASLKLWLDAASKQSYNPTHNLMLYSDVKGASGATLPTGWEINQPFGRGAGPGVSPSNNLSLTIGGIGYWLFDLVGTTDSGNYLLIEPPSYLNPPPLNYLQGIVAGTTYTLTYNYSLPSNFAAVAAISAQINWYDVNNVALTGSGQFAGNFTTWNRSTTLAKSSFSAVAPANAVKAKLWFVYYNPHGAGTAVNYVRFRLGGIQFNIGSSATDYVATTSTQISPSTTWTDISATGNNGSIQTGVAHNALGWFDFNGTTGYVGLANQPTGFAYGAEPGTICAWAKTNTISGGWSWIFSYGSPSSGNSRFIGINGSTYHAGGFGGTGVTGDVTAGGVPLNTWVHVTEVYDSTTAYLYLNGVLAASAAKSWNTTVGIASVGRQTRGDEFWNGSIAQVQVYSRALSATEVAQNFKAGAPRYGLAPNVASRELSNGTLAVSGEFNEWSGMTIVDSSLKLWYDAKLATNLYGSTSTWTDLSGGDRHGTLIGTTARPAFDNTNGGTLKYSFSFDYFTNCVTATSALSLISNSFTMSFWLKVDSYPGTNCGIFTSEPNGFSCFNGGGIGMGIRTSGPSSGFSIQFVIVDGRPDVPPRLPFISNLQTGTWYNMVGTYDISTLEFRGYKNAVLGPTTITPSNSGTVVSNTTYRIGHGGDSNFSGNIASFMLYDRVLSLNEININFEALRGRFGI